MREKQSKVINSSNPKSMVEPVRILSFLCKPSALSLSRHSTLGHLPIENIGADGECGIGTTSSYVYLDTVYVFKGQRKLLYLKFMSQGLEVQKKRKSTMLPYSWEGDCRPLTIIASSEDEALAIRDHILRCLLSLHLELITKVYAKNILLGVEVSHYFVHLRSFIDYLDERPFEQYVKYLPKSLHGIAIQMLKIANKKELKLFAKITKTLQNGDIQTYLDIYKLCLDIEWKLFNIHINDPAFYGCHYESASGDTLSQYFLESAMIAGSTEAMIKLAYNCRSTYDRRGFSMHKGLTIGANMLDELMQKHHLEAYYFYGSAYRSFPSIPGIRTCRIIEPNDENVRALEEGARRGSPKCAELLIFDRNRIDEHLGYKYHIQLRKKHYPAIDGACYGFAKLCCQNSLATALLKRAKTKLSPLEQFVFLKSAKYFVNHRAKFYLLGRRPMPKVTSSGLHPDPTGYSDEYGYNPDVIIKGSGN